MDQVINLNLFHYFTKGIHIEVLNNEIRWLMGIPFGLKTNPNLSTIMG